MQLLLAKGADVNLRGGFYDCAIQAALAGDHDNIVQFLPAKGVDVNLLEFRCHAQLETTPLFGMADWDDPISGF